MASRDVNLDRTKRWSFHLDSGLRRNKTMLYEGEEVVLSAVIRNDGLEIGTAYVRILIAKSSDRDAIVFDSNRDFPTNARLQLRLVDIPVGGTKSVACPWVVPTGIADVHFDIRFQLWSPQLLSNEPEPYLFDDSDWVGGFYVINQAPARARVFVSYSWDGAEHEEWVRQLATEFRKYDIEYLLDKDHALAGDEITHFIEQGLQRSTAVILVCTEKYTRKANARNRGVGFETILYSEQYLSASRSKRSRFIPVVRNNHLTKKLPKYLGSAKYIDMSGDDWRAEPMIDLVRSIQRHAPLRTIS